ncbi:UNVERIFIED_CONTAM: hypothetical protein RMT77_018293 [Armadillidium vulgare]
MVSRLEDLCGIQVAIELANELEIKKEILRLQGRDLDDNLWDTGGEPWFENMEKKVLDALKKLPFVLRGKIPIPLVIFCLIQSIEWAKFHNEEFDLPFDYSCSFLRSSLFTSKGILNKEKAAREILKDTELSPSLKFCIACHYCLTDVIPALWEQLPEDKRPKMKNKVFENGFCIGGRNKMADLWSYSLLGELQILMKGRDDSFSLYKFKKTFDNETYRNCSDVAFKKCFEELNEFEKEEAVIFARDKLKNLLSDLENYDYCDIETPPHLLSLEVFMPFQKYLEMTIFFLHHLDQRQLMVFFEPVMLHYVLFHLLCWPYQHMFMDVVSQFWEVLPKTGFVLLLHRIVNLIKNESYCKLSNYHYILRDFWVQSSPSLKRFFFRLEGISKGDMRIEFSYEEREDYFVTDLHSDFELLKFSYVIFELFHSPFTIEDEKIIRLIFSSATLEEKSDIVWLQGNGIGRISFNACDLRRIDLFIECCVPKEEIGSFKIELFNDEIVTTVLFFLVRYKMGEEFQKILKWAFSAEEIKEWLKNFLLYVRQEWKLRFYCSTKEVKCIEKNLGWALSSNEMKNFKSSFVTDLGDITRDFKSSLSRGNFQDIDFILEWIFSSKIEILKFKKDLSFESIDYIGHSFLSSGLSSLKKFIEWSSLSKEESKDFRRQLAFSEKVIEYYSKLVAQRQLCEVDSFIQWAELTETEVKKFKKLLVFNVEGKVLPSCASSILNGKDDFVKKLLSWTEFSKEEIRELYSVLPEELNLSTHIIEENALSNINKFFNTLSLSKKEIKRVKKNLLFKSIDDVTEYFVMGNKWNEFEELLGWCFSSKTEIIEFKKKIPLEINNTFLKLISCQRYDDVDKFFTWTGVHNSLKNRLLKKAIFDSRVYEIVRQLLYHENYGIIERLLNFLSAKDLLLIKWKESFLIWNNNEKNKLDCCNTNGRPDNRGVQLNSSSGCGFCRSFIEYGKRFIKLFNKHYNKLKVRPKRKLESSLKSNSSKRKRRRHC